MRGFRWRETRSWRLQVPAGLHTVLCVIAFLGLLTVFGSDVIEDYAPKWVEIVVAFVVALSWFAAMTLEPWTPPDEEDTPP